MMGIQKNPKVVELAGIPGIKDTLDMILDQLDRCQKALNDFLEEKRSKFSRFYFLGDDDLLEILGQSKNPNIIQMHLKKLFAGIHSVQFNSDTTLILALNSSAGEKVPLKDKVAVGEEVEIWLNSLTKNMQATLKELLRECLSDQKFDIERFPSQILCLAEAIKFNQYTQSEIESKSILSYKQELSNRLQKFTGLTSNTSQLNKLKLKALILDLIHHIDILDSTIEAKITNVKE